MPWWQSFRYSLIWGFIIAILTLTPGDDLPDPPLIDIPHLDKFVHFMLFGVLSFLLSREFFLKKFPKKMVGSITLIIMAICLIYSGLIEIIQQFIPHRSGDWWDLLANFTGISAGVVTFWIITGYKDKTE